VTRAILCGVDDSRHARAALRVAAQLAGQLEARLLAVHVVHTGLASPELPPAHPLLVASALDAAVDGGEALLERILAEEHVDAERQVVHGFAADRLADLADDVGAELIVVGSRGRGAFKSAVLGSVSRELIGVARRPVVVVPAGAVDSWNPCSFS